MKSFQETVMADLGSTEKYRKPGSAFFRSPRLFTPFSSKNLGDSETLMSPTSILDTRTFPAFMNPLWSETNSPPKSPKRDWEPKGVGLSLVDALIDDEKSESKQIKTESRMVLFGSQLKIQIPPLHPSVLSPSSSPPSPSDFGILTRNSQLGSLSPSPMKKSSFGSSNCLSENPNSPPVFSSLSATEMELSEDYTCVISYGPNPRTTHIFGDCIVQSCGGVVRYSESKKDSGFFTNNSMKDPSECFLSSCHTCKKNLGLGKDIYMYR